MPDEPAVTTTTPITEATPNYLGDTVRSTSVPLKFPFELDGIEYRTVTVRRITGREAQSWSRALREFLAGDGPEPQFPGIVMPSAAFDALDDDDLAALDEAADRFFPARFQPLRDLAARMAGEPSATYGAA